MRFLKAQQLLTVAIAMQAGSYGLSINDIIETIQERFGEKISRRTAERLRDALLRMFPQIHEVESSDEYKKWKMSKGTIDRMIHFSAEEIAAIEMAVEWSKSQDLPGNTSILRNLCDKLESLISDNEQARLLPDIEALTEAEGIAFRPKPFRACCDPEIISELRMAILASKKVYISYYYDSSDTIKRQKIEPYGFLYKDNNYLVAYLRHKSDYRNFKLANIKKIEMIDEYFDRDEDFSLKEYTKDSFGVFREEPFKVQLEFADYVAEQVMNFDFHPSQKKDIQSDGKVLVELYVGGSLELCRHLFTWGDSVKILSPNELKQQYCQMLGDISDVYK